MNEHIQNYLAGIDSLKAAVAGLTPAQLTARPVPGKWSVLEVVAHLTDFEPISADRMKRILAEEKPLLIGADEQKFVAALNYHDRDLAEELAIVTATRRQMARILEKAPPGALQRQGVHSERGLVTLERILELAIKHIPHHVAFIHEKRQALGV